MRQSRIGATGASFGFGGEARVFGGALQSKCITSHIPVVDNPIVQDLKARVPHAQRGRLGLPAKGPLVAKVWIGRWMVDLCAVASQAPRGDIDPRLRDQVNDSGVLSR